MTCASPEVEDMEALIERIAYQHGISRSQVALCEIRDVNEVSDSCPVWSVPVCPKCAQSWSITNQSVDHDRHEVVRITS